MNQRTCIVTKKKLPQADMIRFVVCSSSFLCLDMEKTLPGRGIWIKAQRSIVDKAMQKNIFQRVLKKNVIISKDFGACVDHFLKGKALKTMCIAFKAGFVVEGFTKVYNAIRLGQALFALDAHQDSTALSETEFHSIVARDGGVIFAVEKLFEGKELDIALGKSNVRYIAGLRGNFLSQSCLESIKFLQLYRKESTIVG